MGVWEEGDFQGHSRNLKSVVDLGVRGLTCRHVEWAPSVGTFEKVSRALWIQRLKVSHLGMESQSRVSFKCEQSLVIVLIKMW